MDEDEPAAPVCVAVVLLAEPTLPEDEESAEFFACLPKLLRELRIEHCGLSQRELAKRLEVPRTYVSKVENGKAMPTFLTLERYAQELGTRGSSIIALMEDPDVQLAGPMERVDDSILRQVGATFRRFRKQAQMSQGDLEAVTNVMRTRISTIEAGRHTPRLTFFKKFADGVRKKTSTVIAAMENAAFPSPSASCVLR